MDANSDDKPFQNNDSFQERYGLTNHDQVKKWTIKNKASAARSSEKLTELVDFQKIEGPASENDYL